MALRLMKSDIIHCTECSFRKDSKRPVPGFCEGKDYQAAAIAQNPGVTEDNLGRPLIGDSGKLLRECFKEVGVDTDTQLYLDNVVHCLCLKTPTKKQALPCAEKFLFPIINKLKCEFVLLLGAVPLQALFPMMTITATRGQLLKHDDYPDKWFFATFHPSAILRDVNKESTFRNDIRAFWNFVEEGVPEKIKTKYMILTEDRDVNKVLKELSKKSLLSFDIETIGLDPFADDFLITAISFGYGEGQAVVIPVKHKEYQISKVNFKLLKELLENKEIKKIAHNAIFDIKCLKTYGINVRGLYWDTQIVPYLEDENKKMLSLKELAAEFTDLGHYEQDLFEACGLAKASKEKKAVAYRIASWELLSLYAAKDADATFRLYKLFKGSVSKRVKRLLKLYLKVVYCIVDMELEGWFIREDNLAYDFLNEKNEELLEKFYSLKVVKRFQVDKWKEWKREVREKKNFVKFISKCIYVHNYIRTKEVDGKLVKEKRKRKVKEDPKKFRINLRSPQQKVKLLTEYAGLFPSKRTAGGAFSVDKEVLTEFSKTSPMCNLMLQQSEVSKLLTTYTKKMMDKRSDDGRLRTQYNLVKTGSSRLSSSNPNLQNVPSRGQYAPAIKKQFGAPEGMIICEADFSQIELRVYCSYSKDKNMSKAYGEGKDIHKQTAAIVFDIEEGDVTKTQRSVAKTANFGLIYGISAERFRAQLRTEGGIKISSNEAKRIHKAFFTAYPAAKRYHRAIEKYVSNKGYIDTKFGSRRHLPAAFSLDNREQSAAFRIAYNHPIQGTSAGILFEALIRVRKVLRKTPARLLGTVHDSILVYVPEKDWKNYARLIKDAMEDFKYEWQPIHIPVGVSIGETWGEMRELEGDEL